MTVKIRPSERDCEIQTSDVCLSCRPQEAGYVEHSCPASADVRRYQALSRFSVLQATESRAGLGNETTPSALQSLYSGVGTVAADGRPVS